VSAREGPSIVAPVAMRLPPPLPNRRRSDGACRARAVGVVAGVYLLAGLIVTLAVVVVDPGVRAATASEVVLGADGAPLASVLAHLASFEGGEARVAEDIPDKVSGPLVGEAAVLIGLLVDAHRLTLYREGRTLWFDREGRTVVDFVPLDRPVIVRALEALAAPVAPGGTVQVEASGRGLVLSGTRAYVRTSLARIALATGVAVEPDTPRGRDTRVPLPGLARAVSAVGGEALAERIVLVSSSPPRFVQLDDGTRLEIGATLVDGRRLRAIERERLVFENEGVAWELAFR